MRTVRVLLQAVVAMAILAAMVAPAMAAPDEGEVLSALQQRIEKVAENVGKSVVSVTIKGRAQQAMNFNRGIPLDDLPPEFRRFFDVPNDDGQDDTNPNATPRRRRRAAPQQPREDELVPMGLGSGIILTSDGYIVTNQHVVERAEAVSVTLSDKRQFEAKVIGQDPRRDLAVLKIEAKDLPAATFDGKASPSRGMFVLAIGSPFGFGAEGEASVSFGIVSGTRRSLGQGQSQSQDRYYGKLIQTDAAINPGNSGGALCDLDGKVIGINVAIASQSGGSQGVGFAIPIDDLTLSIIQRLKKGESQEYGFLGVGVRNPTTEESQTAGAPEGVGALVMSAEPDSPAAKAGIQPADLITELKGKKLKDSDDLVTDIGVTPPGEKVKVTLYRSGKKMEVEAVVVRRPGSKAASGSGGSKKPSASGSDFSWRGMSVEELTASIRGDLGLDDGVKGVYVSSVEKDSAAQKAGLRQGAVIDQVGSIKVGSVKEFKEAVAKLKGRVFVNVVGVGPGIVGE